MLVAVIILIHANLVWDDSYKWFATIPWRLKRQNKWSLYLKTDNMLTCEIFRCLYLYHWSNFHITVTLLHCYNGTSIMGTLLVVPAGNTLIYPWLGLLAVNSFFEWPLLVQEKVVAKGSNQDKQYSVDWETKQLFAKWSLTGSCRLREWSLRESWLYQLTLLLVPMVSPNRGSTVQWR